MEVKPGYKQTEVGVIPEEWDAVPISSLTPQNRKNGIVDGPFGSNLKTIHYRTSGIPIITSGYVTDGKFYADKYLYVDRSKFLEEKRSAVQPGDIVMAKIGERCGASAILPRNHETGILSGNALKITVDEARHSTSFVWQVLWNLHVSGKLEVLRTVGAQPALSMANLKRFKISVPSTRTEQVSIATALSDVDGLLGGLDRLIAKKRDLKQAAMQQLLTGQTRLPGFHGKWARLNMAENSTLKARIGWQGLTTAEYLKTGEYLLVTGTDFSEGRIDWTNCCYVAVQRYAQDRNIQLRPNDILLTKDGTIGKVAFVDDLPGPATLNSGVFVIRPREQAYDPRYFFYVLTSRIFDEFLTRLQAGSTITHLYQKDFVTFSFLAPATIPEQTAIAEVLTEMDAELAGLEQRREKTRAVKQAMMQELLTGKTRLI
jgi:type I restriction enzyme, S subunit